MAKGPAKKKNKNTDEDQVLIALRNKNVGDSFWASRQDTSKGRSAASQPMNVQYLVMAMGGVIVLLSAVMMYMVFQMESKPKTAAPVVAPKIEVQPALFEALVAKQAIQKGTQVVKEMLTIKKIPLDQRPEGVLSVDGAPLIIGKFTDSNIPEGQLLQMANFSSAIENVFTPFYIPPGYRAITITVDGRTGVEGYAQPGTRVDVLWFSKERAQVTTIVPYARVLSVAGITQVDNKSKLPKNSTTATLLVTKKQAHTIELARNMGSLMLSLVGSEEPKEADADIRVRERVTMDDMFPPSRLSRPDAIMKMYNEATGELDEYILNRDQKWVLREKQEEVLKESQ
jgi:Flp pilus assembly protein CpaB